VRTGIVKFEMFDEDTTRNSKISEGELRIDELTYEPQEFWIDMTPDAKQKRGGKLNVWMYIAESCAADANIAIWPCAEIQEVK